MSTSPFAVQEGLRHEGRVLEARPPVCDHIERDLRGKWDGAKADATDFYASYFENRYGNSEEAIKQDLRSCGFQFLVSEGSNKEVAKKEQRSLFAAREFQFAFVFADGKIQEMEAVLLQQPK